MTGLFEVIASENREDKLPNRQATAVAEARVDERFGSFLRGSKGEYEFEQRLALVQDDLNEVVRAVADELGASNADHISGSLIENFKRNIVKKVARGLRPCEYCGGTGEDEQYGPCAYCGGRGKVVDDLDEPMAENVRHDFKPTHSKVARRPRLCPYHNEVVGISLADAAACI